MRFSHGMQTLGFRQRSVANKSQQVIPESFPGWNMSSSNDDRSKLSILPEDTKCWHKGSPLWLWPTKQNLQRKSHRGDPSYIYPSSDIRLPTRLGGWHLM